MTIRAFEGGELSDGRKDERTGVLWTRVEVTGQDSEEKQGCLKLLLANLSTQFELGGSKRKNLHRRIGAGFLKEIKERVQFRPRA